LNDPLTLVSVLLFNVEYLKNDAHYIVQLKKSYLLTSSVTYRSRTVPLR